MRVLFFITFFICFVLSLDHSFQERKVINDSTLSRASYPSWAHSHWVWLESSDANQTSLQQLVSDYLIRNVPVGAVDVDSQWATGDTNFIWDTTKYPNAKQMISNFHELGVRVICWVVSVNNVEPLSSTYQFGLENNYYLNSSRASDPKGHEGLINWWHGTGAMLDYTNPDALDWWHSQMDDVLNMGLDGWKCDGTDPYVMEMYPIKSYSGQIHYREYADLYYGDFFNHSKTVNPNALIMSRPVDNYLFVYWSFSPRYVMYSGWVGDQDPNFEGLQDALRNYIHSAWRNYTNYGSDIGGYRSSNDYGPLGRTKEVFIRWAQLGAFSPLMENGGDGEHRPWMFDNTNQTLDIYRQFVKFHYELNPYFLNAGTISMETGVSVMYPQANKTDSILKSFHPDSWDYKLWHDILVSPIVRNSTERSITFPVGDNWVDWWDTSKVYSGGSTVHKNYPLEQYPLFYRQGALLALHVQEDLRVGHGNGNNFLHSEPKRRPASTTEVDYWLDDEVITLFIAHPTSFASQQIRSFSSKTQELFYTYDHHSGVFHFQATPHKRPLLLVIRGVDSPSSVINSMWMIPQSIQPVSSKLSFDQSNDACWVHIIDDHENKDGALWIKFGDTSEGFDLTIHSLFYSSNLHFIS